MRHFSATGWSWTIAWVAIWHSVAAQEVPRGATTVQLPTFGVSVDTAGVLAALERETNEALLAARSAAARTNLGADLSRRSPLRKVALHRLERALALKQSAGQSPDEAMRRLAGLLQVQYVFLYPDEHEIVLAGEAEGWLDDGLGHAVGLTTRRATLDLADLVTAFAAYGPESSPDVFVGCTIDPSEDGLARWREFQRSVPRTIAERERETIGRQIAGGQREALGEASIRVFGIPAESHLARVLVEADYRMKRIGVGVEPAPVRITSFFQLVNSASIGAVERWWLTPRYESLAISEDRLSIELSGLGVQLLTEQKRAQADGSLIAAGTRNPASEQFCQSFTRQYERLAAADPVFGQLRNGIELLIVAALLKHEEAFARTGWSSANLRDGAKLQLHYAQAPRSAAVVTNAAWKGSRFVAVAGGGVSIRAHEALSGERLQTERTSKLQQRRSEWSLPSDERWWWD